MWYNSLHSSIYNIILLFKYTYRVQNDEIIRHIIIRPTDAKTMTTGLQAIV